MLYLFNMKTFHRRFLKAHTNTFQSDTYCTIIKLRRCIDNSNMTLVDKTRYNTKHDMRYIINADLISILCTRNTIAINKTFIKISYQH